MYALDQVHVLRTDPDVVIVKEPARIAVLVVLVAVHEVVSQLYLVLLGFHLASIVEVPNTSHHFRSIVIAISAQETSIFTSS